MESLMAWISVAIAVVGALGTVITAVATYFLWRVTQTLAKETSRMAEAAAQPHVVITITPNQWSMRHADVHIDNTGNATAYDIKVKVDPPLENGEARGEKETPFNSISVLKPGQGISSYISDFQKLIGKDFVFEIEWARNFGDVERQSNRYVLSMADHSGVSRLGDEPMISIANSIKKIQEAWNPVAAGSRRTKMDVYSGADRLRERREAAQERRRWMEESQSAAAAETASSDKKGDGEF